LAAQGLLPVPEGSTESNTYAGIVGAVVGFLAVTLAVTIGVKAYKKQQLKQSANKYKKTPQDPRVRDEESPPTPMETLQNRTSVSILSNPLMRNQLQSMDIYRTSHSPVQVHNTSSRRLPTGVQVRNPALSIQKKDGVPVQPTMYYNALPKVTRPVPTNRIKSIQFQQQQRMLRLAKEDEIDTTD
jgi:hypothetical protein